ncbi:MAG: fumarylacetoacetase [Pseudomonadales bacterium]
MPVSPVNATHDPNLSSWVAAANSADTDFPIQNLPFAVLRRQGSSETFRCAVAIGDHALDLTRLRHSGVLEVDDHALVELCCDSSLNRFMAAGHRAWSSLRQTLSRLLQAEFEQRAALTQCLLPLDTVEYHLPATVGDYTDFYTSIHHATNIGKLFRPDAPLLPNYRWVPIGYHGRSSSIVVSGQDFERPYGQRLNAGAETPVFGPCQRLDYELELGMFIGPGNALGHPININEADEQLFGVCLLNDWSARDIQSWEYQPLGPFLGKNFASSLSPWIVTAEALAPFKQPWRRAATEPAPLPYLVSQADAVDGALNITLEAYIETPAMRQQQLKPLRLSQANFQDVYWTPRQLIAHHSANGCNLRPGDLLGSGTVSGSNPGSEGALIEITQGGRRPLKLPDGEQRAFLEDGDRIILRGYCEAAGCRRIGMGEVVGTVLAAESKAAQKDASGED